MYCFTATEPLTEYPWLQKRVSLLQTLSAHISVSSCTHTHTYELSVNNTCLVQQLLNGCNNLWQKQQQQQQQPIPLYNATNTMSVACSLRQQEEEDPPYVYKNKQKALRVRFSLIKRSLGAKKRVCSSGDKLQLLAA